MSHTRRPILIVLLLVLVQIALGFSPSSSTANPLLQRHGYRNTNHLHPSETCPLCPPRSSALQMGFFDSISAAFANNDYETQDQRVRASHILIKGDDVEYVMTKTKSILEELNDRVQQVNDDAEEGAISNNIAVVQPIFSELAMRESQCPSRTEGGDLGSFGRGKMAPEFDAVLFPEAEEARPPVGALVGPVVTDFGMHIILLTERSVDRNQVEEKLARND